MNTETIDCQGLNEMAAEVHELNKKWWLDIVTGQPLERNRGELLMLVITELSEAVEGIRKNLMDDKVPTRKMEEVEMADAFIRLLDYAGGFRYTNLTDVQSSHLTLTIEFADNKADQILAIVAAVYDIYANFHDDPNYSISVCLKLIRFYCQRHNLDLFGAYREKMEYNRTRQDYTHEARLLANGKKF
jgi:hypothetical protein